MVLMLKSYAGAAPMTGSYRPICEEPYHFDNGLMQAFACAWIDLKSLLKGKFISRCRRRPECSARVPAISVPRVSNFAG